ncbi:MAG TPA: fumarylacetoacetate hydrolase family protein [Myxococcota bacterium]|nr:fumarylacetoacetate hydrolase family protein [Myxococcota bacterium]HOA14145.1 fumarylacetoacetate hydrolase family protein [Myxococcota bacterium]HOH77316.1 fumarylacetoacetate hydrolase family protein [Myxococcota bacterium]HPV04830.1 fumarylacetoacetate hydrolase family protein [Myxococcota bacterium]
MKVGFVSRDGRIIPVMPTACGLQDLSRFAEILLPGFNFPVGIALLRALSDNEPRTMTVLQAARSAAAREDGCMTVDPEGIRWLPPVPDTRQIIAVGLNYRSHCIEQNIPIPAEPKFFAKLVSSLTGHLEPIRLWEISSRIDYEGELGIVIGRQTRAVTLSGALACIGGYTIVNDVSARDLQKGDGQWTRAKGLDTFCPMGPFLTTPDEVPDPDNLRILTTVNDVIRQDCSTSDMIFGVARLVSTISNFITLMPGDVISTGTPCGVGLYSDPPCFLKAGDVVNICIEGLGTLSNVAMNP